MLWNKKIPYAQLKQKKSTKLKIIKNCSFKWLNIHQCRGVLRTSSNIQEEDFCKNSQGFSVINCFCKKNPSQKSELGPNRYYKILLRKF